MDKRKKGLLKSYPGLAEEGIWIDANGKVWRVEELKDEHLRSVHKELMRVRWGDFEELLEKKIGEMEKEIEKRRIKPF